MTDNELEKLVSDLREVGPREFASWNAAAFEYYVKHALVRLSQHIKWRDKKVADNETLANFVRLVYQGCGAGWLLPQGQDSLAPTYLAHCLLQLIPYRLAEIDRKQRGEVLRNIWNLGEGLAQQPQWLNQYAIARSPWSTDIAALEQHLETILAPVLTPLAPATWQGGYSLKVLDVHRSYPEFVPGEMYLAAPAVLCVKNRINTENTIAVLLERAGSSDVLGTVPALPRYSELFARPQIAVSATEIRVNGQVAAQAMISAPAETLCISSGFIAVTAEDSQRLWLLEAK